MSADPIYVLLIEDEPDHAELVRRAFEAVGSSAHLQVAQTLADARALLEQNDPCSPTHLVIADWRLPDGESLELLSAAADRSGIPFVLMTSHGNERVAVEAMRRGALDYVVKSDSVLRDMPQIAGRALRQWQHIVERRRAEAALRDSEERYRLITERATDIISLVDQSGMIIYASPSVQRILGYAPVSLVGTSVFDYVHSQDLAAVRDRWSQLSVAGQADVIYRCRHQDGSWRWLDAQGSLFTQAGDPYAVIVGRDVTERRRLEEQLFQAQKLEAIGQLAGGIAHDFNNLLVVITGCADLALLGMAPDDPSRAELHEILRASRRAASLTRQMLAFARRELSEPQILRLNSLILEMDRMLRRLIRADIALVIDAAPDLWPTWADYGQIEQVLLNLVVNARDAMPQGGRLTIATANTWLDKDETTLDGTLVPGAYALLTVTDTGIGMSEEVRRHAFEPFFSTKRPGEGTGLGLATCYGIIRQHGGGITLDSEPGRGTTVRVYLPRANESPAPRPTVAEDKVLPRGNETVLLVEDEPAVRTLAARILRAHGYRVLEAADGATALAIAGSPAGASLDALLTDLVMPELGGLDLVRRLQSQHPHLRVLLMSGYTDNQVLVNGLIERGVGWIAKPFMPADLVRKLRDVLDGSEPTGE